MVDYFALIAPTIESLAKSTADERRQVYDRLIKMLEAQLRTSEPPRSEIDILRERIDLEAAIRRVERRIQAGQIAVGKPVTPDALKPVDQQMAASSTAPIPEPPKVKLPQPSEPQSAPDIRDELPNPEAVVTPHLTETAQTPVEPARQPSGLSPALSPMAPRSPEPMRQTPYGEAQAPRQAERPPNFPPRNPARPQSPVGPVGSAAQPNPAIPPGPPRRPPLPTDLPPGPPRRSPGELAQPQSSPFRQAPPSRSPFAEPNEPDAGRPIFGPREGEPRAPVARSSDLPASFRSMPGALTSHPVPRRQGETGRNLPPLPPLPSAQAQATEQQIAFGLNPRVEVPPSDPVRRDHDDRQRDDEARDRSRLPREPNYDATTSSTSNDTARPTVSINSRSRSSMMPFRGPGGWKRMGIITLCIAAILGGIALTAYMLRDDPAEFKTAAGKYAPTEKPQAEEKISDRLAPQSPTPNAQNGVTGGAQSNASPNTPSQQGNAPQSGPSSPTPDANGVLTQKAMLVMEPSDQSSPAPTLNARVVWKLETLKSVVDTASEIGARATVEIAEAGLGATIIFRRNRDPQSANSHMIEVNFTLADNNSTGKVRDIRVPELRTEENARGTPLSGVPVPVTENVFLVGLNALPSEMQKNLDLLRTQNWFAMPLRFANGKRGILMFEKGKTGERIMEDAMQAWKSN